jgi:hypothetical protein
MRAHQYLVDAASSRRVDVGEGRFDLTSGMLEMAVRLPDERGDYESSSAATTFLVVPPYYYFQDGSGGWYRTASLDRFGVPSAEPAAILRFLRCPVLAATERPGENGCRVAMVEIHVDRALAHASPEDRASMAAFAEVLGLHDDELRADVTLAGDGSLAGNERESVHGRAGLQFFDVGTPLEFSGPPAYALDLDTT